MEISYKRLDERKKYLVAMVIPAVCLLLLIIPWQIVSMLGSEIMLKTVPVDPRDFFRGDYVRLNFEINRAPKALYQGAQDLNNRERPVFVVLKKQDTYAGIDYITDTRPSKDTTYLEAKGKSYAGGEIILDYGFDRFFVEENTGLQYETAVRKSKVYGSFKVLRGKAVLTELKIED